MWFALVGCEWDGGEVKESGQEKAAGAGAYDCDSGSGGGVHSEDVVVTLLVGP